MSNKGLRSVIRVGRFGVLAIVLPLVVVIAGCGAGLPAIRPTPTLVPLPEFTPTPVPEAQPVPEARERDEAAQAVTPTAVEAGADAERPAAATASPTQEATASPTPRSQATAAPSPAATPSLLPPEGVVQAGRLNVRTGPGTAYPRVGQVEEGTKVQIVGRNEKSTWWQIEYAGAAEGLAWVSAEYVETALDAAEISVVEAAPPPEPLPVVEDSGFTGRIVFQESSGGRIFVVNADGSGLTYLTNGLDPAWSPDGSQVVFTRWEWDPPGVFVINADGSGEEQIVPGPKAKGARWSPDGSRIAFTSERKESAGKFCFQPPFGPAMCMTLPKEKHWKLSVLDVGTGQVMDPNSDPFSFAPSWSPDGTRLVYDGVQGLRPADPIGGHDQKAAYIDYDARDMYPVWSPTSDRIAFMYRQHDHWEIYAVNADGSGRARLTESPLFEAAQNSVAPEWTPDGEWIAFLTDRVGEWEVWVMRPDGSEEQPLFPPGALEGIDFQYYEQSEHVLDWWMPSGLTTR